MDKYDVLKKYFGYDKFKEIQEKAIDSIMEGRDTVVLLATGGGKSLIFQIPALLLEGITIVVTPLISLMVDQVRILKEKRVKSEYLNSSMEDFEIKEVYKRVLNGRVKILYVSAERLLNQYFLQIIEKVNVSILCLDESHSIEDRYAFRPAYGYIPKFLTTRKKRPVVVAVTATATKDTLHSIIEGCSMIDPNVFQSNFDRPNLYYSSFNVKNKEKWLYQYIEKNKNRGIIYCLTRNKVEALYQILKDKRNGVFYYHGGMDSDEKIKNQKHFVETKNAIMVATISFGLGVDLPDVRFVVLYDLPSSIENLVQMVGRCSRDGKYGEGIVLYQQKDIETNLFFIHSLSKIVVNREVLLNETNYRHEKLRKVIDFCTKNECLHKQILSYFSQIAPSRCNNCSRCVNNGKYDKL